MRRSAVVGLGVVALGLGAIATADPAAAGNVFNGRKLYNQHCASCHGQDGRPTLPGTPNLARGEGLLAPDRLLMRSLQFGKGLMPGFEAVLRGRDILDVIAYTRSLHR